MCRGTGGLDVCAAIEEMKMNSRIEGKVKGKLESRIKGKMEGSIETYREVGYSLKDTIKCVAEKFILSLQKSEDSEEVRKC